VKKNLFQFRRCNFS